MSDLVGKPEEKFSGDDAQTMKSANNRRQVLSKISVFVVNITTILLTGPYNLGPFEPCVYKCIYI